MRTGTELFDRHLEEKAALAKLIPHLARVYVATGGSDDGSYEGARIVYECRHCESYGYHFGCDARHVFEQHMAKHKENAEAGRPQERVRAS